MLDGKVGEPSPVGVGSLEKVLVDGISASVHDELNHAFEQAQELPRCHGRACHVRNVPFHATPLRVFLHGARRQ